MTEPLVVTTASSARVEISVEDDGTCVVRPVGVINEDINFSPVLKHLTELNASNLRVKFDLGSIERMNSCGVREWLMFVERLPSTCEKSFVNVNEVWVDLANIVPGLLGKGASRVRSFKAPYFCERCKEVKQCLLIPADVAHEEGRAKAPARKCEKCGSALLFESLEEEYFRFLTVK
jgi:hypothetical protein